MLLNKLSNFNKNIQPHRNAKLPEDMNRTVWHYMDRWKFKSLIKEKEIYLCRADLLQDKFEGTYSRFQVQEDNEWLERHGYSEINVQLKKQRIQDRKERFIHCWNMSDYDLDLMWKAYVKSPSGVAIKSTVGRLKELRDQIIKNYLIDCAGLELSTVTYYDQEKGSFSVSDGFELFVHKDYHFNLDNEIRIICWYRSGSYPKFVKIPVNLELLIDRIVISPSSSICTIKQIRNMMVKYGLSKKVIEYSRNDRPVAD